MKWNKPGKEYEEYSKVFTIGKKIAIYGAGEKGIELFRKVSFVNCVDVFIDNDLEKQKEILCGIRVVGIVEFLNKYRENDPIVIVAMGKEKRDLIMNQMRNCGYRDGYNLFEVYAFSEYYLPLYMMYSWKKLYFHSVGITLTTICNFHCKGCLAFIPINHNQKHYDVNMFIDSLDHIFKYVDFINIFQLSGGETFLYPNQIQLLDYIGKKYREKIGILYTTTNGSVLPSKELCEKLAENKVTVIIDDYTKTVPKNKEKMQKLLDKLRTYKIEYLLNKVDSWIDLAPLSTDNSYMTIDELQYYYMACSQPWIELFENRLYSCNYAQYAMRAGLIEDSDNDWFDLSGEVDVKELLEFRMGYTKNGYLNMCKKCSGYIAINKNIITPAEQEI